MGCGRQLILAFATPLFFYGVTVWEHSIAVALCLGAWLSISRPTPARIALAGALVVLGCAFRTEVALMGLALAAACGLARRRAADLVALALGASPIAAALLAFHLAIYGDALGPHVSATLLAEAAAAGPARSALGSIVGWARTATGLATGYGTSAVEALALGACGVGALALGVGSALRSEHHVARRGAHLAVALALSAWAYAFIRIFIAADPLAVLNRYNGLLIQLPLAALAAVGAVRAWRDPELATIRPSLLASLLFVAIGIGLLATSRYSSGVHWGLRFLLPAFPALERRRGTHEPG